MNLSTFKSAFTGLIVLLFVVSCTSTSTEITHLRVQYNVEPLAIEDQHPIFGWQMESDTKGQKQNAYQIVVKDSETNMVVWDSKKVDSGLSQGIVYDGQALKAESAYSWELTVWDANDKTFKEKSYFETGLMNPELSAWNGAQFVGSNDLILDAASAILFEIKTNFQIKKGDKASLVFGANDFRYNNSFLNNERVGGENYVRVELDLSGVGKAQGAILNFYRVGHSKEDKADVPFKSISSKTFPETNINQIITPRNKNNVHELAIYVEASNIMIEIDGETLRTVAASAGRGGSGFFTGSEGEYRDRLAFHTLNSAGGGNNYGTFPNLNSIGFGSEPGSEVEFTNYQITYEGRSNPNNNVAFDANTGDGYSIFDDLEGVSVNGSTITVANNSNTLSVAYADPSHGSLTMVRSEFETTSGKKIKKAKLYVTSMGSNEMFINGEKVGEDWFGPGDTQFRETLGYLAYDVTHMVRSGENAMGAILNPGWYTGYMTFTPANLNFFGDTEALLSKLVITYSDGSRQTVVTDPSTWKVYKNGPIENGSFFQGERYNAQKEAAISVDGNVNGWATTAYDDSQWLAAEVVKPRDWIDFDLMARYDQPVRVAETLRAQQLMPIHSEDETTYTYDMGVNMVGVPSISIPAGWLSEGDEVIIRYGEQVYPGLAGDKPEYVALYGSNGKDIAGRILTETYRAAMSTDFYTAKNSEAVTIQPSTTFRGYQFIEITIPGHQGSLPLENVKGIVLSSDKLQAGTYHATTSDGTTGQLVNQLFSNIQRSQLGNFFTIPTDCPQRNERMGWTGDAQAYTRTATYNSDVRNFFRQWMVALRDDQGVGSETDVAGGIGSTVPTFNMADETQFADGTTWAAAVCQVPWQLYNQYGDTQIIEENMETMMAWLNGMDHYDFSNEYTYLSSKTTGLADWLAMDSRTPSQLANNAIYIYMMEVTAVMAEAVGRDDYAATLRDRHAKAKAEWNQVYVDPETGRTRDANGTIIHSQTSYATPLNFNAFSDANKAKAEAYLAELTANPSKSNTHLDGSRVKYPESTGFSFGGSPAKPEDFLPYTITTGFSGTPNILPALSKAGNVEDAYKLFSSTDYTSWLYPVTMGATSIWERWNGYEAAFQVNNQNFMNSFNHFALGAVGQWMYEYQLGIASDHANGEAGYKHFVLQPQAGGKFTALEGSYESNYGVVKSAWEQNNQGDITLYRTTVPANTSATLFLPVSNKVNDFSSAEGVEFIGKTTRNNVQVAQFELGSGTYEFELSNDIIYIK